MLHDMFPATAHQINYVLWSISVEWRIYFVFPLILLLWRRYGPASTTVFVVLVSLVIAWLVPVFSHKQLTNLGIHFTGVFAIGMLGATLGFSERPAYKNFARSVNWAKFCGFATLVYALFCLLRVTGYWIPGMPAIASQLLVGIWAGIILTWGSHCSDGIMGRFLANSWLVKIGGFSYSLYLIHPPALQIFWKYVVHPLNLSISNEIFAMCTFGAAFCVLIAYGFYLVAEKPFLSVGKKSKSPPKPEPIVETGTLKPRVNAD